MVVRGTTDICEQQEQSSFQLKKLGSSSSTKKCAKLCCKDSKCTIPLKVKQHCYSVTCAKPELCQIVYEQLKQFEGHRVDKRETDDDDDDDWQHDHGIDLSVYQKRDLFNTANRTLREASYQGGSEGLSESVFAAFLIQETDNDITRRARGIASDASEDEERRNLTQSFGKIYIFNSTSKERGKLFST